MRLAMFPDLKTIACMLGAVMLLAGPSVAGAGPGGLSELPVRADGAPLLQRALLGGKCRRIPFDSVYFEDGGPRRGYILSIGGPRPNTSMDVILEHYPARNGTWTIEVTGCRPNFITLPITTPYVVDVPVRNMPGARRIRIIGENGAVTRRVPGR